MLKFSGMDSNSSPAPVLATSNKIHNSQEKSELTARDGDGVGFCEWLSQASSCLHPLPGLLTGKPEKSACKQGQVRGVQSNASLLYSPDVLPRLADSINKCWHMLGQVSQSKDFYDYDYTGCDVLKLHFLTLPNQLLRPPAVFSCPNRRGLRSASTGPMKRCRLHS